MKPYSHARKVHKNFVYSTKGRFATNGKRSIFKNAATVVLVYRASGSGFQTSVVGVCSLLSISWFSVVTYLQPVPTHDVPGCFTRNKSWSCAVCFYWEASTSYCYTDFMCHSFRVHSCSIHGGDSKLGPIRAAFHSKLWDPAEICSFCRLSQWFHQ